MRVRNSLATGSAWRLWIGLSGVTAAGCGRRARPAVAPLSISRCTRENNMDERGTAVAMEMAPLTVLIVEDSEEDTDLLVLELRRAGYSPNYKRVDTPLALAEALDERHWDLVLSDYSMPQMTMRKALDMV